MTMKRKVQTNRPTDTVGSLEISMSCTQEEMERAEQIIELMRQPNFQVIIKLLVIFKDCEPEYIEKGIQVLELMKNPKGRELIDNILQISDSRRLEALICWSNQYKDGGKSHE